MNKKLTVKRELEKIGKQIHICDGDWTSMPIKAYLAPLWRKKTADFESELTEIGSVKSKYYLYIGPYDCDVTGFGDDAMLVYDRQRYEFKYSDAVLLGDEIVYYTAVLRKLEGNADEN